MGRRFEKLLKFEKIIEKRLVKKGLSWYCRGHVYNTQNTILKTGTRSCDR